MKTILKAGVAAAALAIAMSVTTDAFAADLGSIKDGYSAAPAYVASAVRPLLLPRRCGLFDLAGSVGDVAGEQRRVDGYEYGDGIVDANEVVSTFVTDRVTNVSLENTWLAEGGMGCGSGSRGFRGEVMLGYRGDRELEGEPGVYDPGPSVGIDARRSDDADRRSAAHQHPDLHADAQRV